jgi:hypothetical protein
VAETLIKATNAFLSTMISTLLIQSIGADHHGLRNRKTKRMKVVLYANERNEPASKRLQNVIETCIPSNCLEVFGSSHDFAQRIYQIPRKIDVAVLFVQNHDQLFEIISLKDFLIDVRIILILPDREHLTVKRGHALFPKYTSYIDSNATDVASVLNKMMVSLNANRLECCHRDRW